jgi:hypothetical protein
VSLELSPGTASTVSVKSTKYVGGTALTAAQIAADVANIGFGSYFQIYPQIVRNASGDVTSPRMNPVFEVVLPAAGITFAAIFKHTSGGLADDFFGLCTPGFTASVMLDFQSNYPTLTKLLTTGNVPVTSVDYRPNTTNYCIYAVSYNPANTTVVATIYELGATSATDASKFTYSLTNNLGAAGSFIALNPRTGGTDATLIRAMQAFDSVKTEAQLVAWARALI